MGDPALWRFTVAAASWWLRRCYLIDRVVDEGDRGRMGAGGRGALVLYHGRRFASSNDAIYGPLAAGGLRKFEHLGRLDRRRERVQNRLGTNDKALAEG